jgi:outer membrane immunogenic protein
LKKFIIAVIAFAVTGVATAQPHNWTGFYGGLQFGYKKSAAEETPNYSLPQAKGSGGLAGLQLGYSAKVGGSNLVLGFEADLRKNGSDASRTAETCQGCIGYSNVETVTTKLGTSGSTRLVVGYAIGRVMPYLTGGMAFGSVKTTSSNVYVDSINNQTGSFTSSMTRGAIGPTVGVGLKFAVTTNLVAGAEYRHESFNVERQGGTYSSGDKNLKNNIGLLTVNYRF